MTKQFVVEHGAPGQVAGVTTTEWQDSAQPFAPKMLRGYNPRYATGAKAYCTICKSQFVYKGPRPPRRKRAMGFGVLLAVVLVFLICSRFSKEASLYLLVVFAAVVLYLLVSMVKPQVPYFQQVSGPKRFKHRVRPIGPTESFTTTTAEPATEAAMPKRPREKAWAGSQGECRPTSGQTVRSGVYDSLIIPAHVRDVVLHNVVILADVTIDGYNITGTILVPTGTTTIKRGNNRVYVKRGSWKQIQNYLMRNP